MSGVRTAVVAVHGVCPHPRYEIQDDFAEQLRAALNARKYLGHSWSMAVQWPTIQNSAPDPSNVRATALRIAADADNPANPQADTFDIFEGYWSPIDKNQTTSISVLAWLLRSLFAPLNGYARLWAKPAKTIFDVGYLCVALLLVAVALAACAYFLERAAISYAGLAQSSFAANIFGLRSAAVLVIALIGAYAGWNFIFSAVMTVQRWLRGQEIERTHWRAYFLFALLAVAVVCFFAVNRWFPLKPGPSPVFAAWPAFYLVSSAGALKIAITLARGFLVNFLGDLQIYCTQDENARFYAMREEIREAVESVILQVLTNDPPYDRIFIAGHSLGSTIAMDALIHLHEMAEESELFRPLWRRLRGLLTFGTALEKTRFFFDVRNPSFSASYSRWRDDVYGHLFSESPDVLHSRNDGDETVGIFWGNYWYFHDIVANEIDSYRSTVTPGSGPLLRRAAERTICANARLQSRLFGLLRHPWIHGDYLYDAAFWNGGTDADGNAYEGAADILTIRETDSTAAAQTYRAGRGLTPT